MSYQLTIIISLDLLSLVGQHNKYRHWSYAQLTNRYPPQRILMKNVVAGAPLLFKG